MKSGLDTPPAVRDESGPELEEEAAAGLWLIQTVSDWMNGEHMRGNLAPFHSSIKEGEPNWAGSNGTPGPDSVRGLRDSDCR